MAATYTACLLYSVADPKTFGMESPIRDLWDLTAVSAALSNIVKHDAR